MDPYKLKWVADLLSLYVLLATTWVGCLPSRSVPSYKHGISFRSFENPQLYAAPGSSVSNRPATQKEFKVPAWRPSNSTRQPGKYVPRRLAHLILPAGDIAAITSPVTASQQSSLNDVENTTVTCLMDGHESCYGTRGNGTCCKNHPGQVEVRPHGGLLDSNPASPADGLTKRPLSNNNRPLKGLVPTFISRIKQPPGGANDTAATQQVHPAKPIEQHEEEIASTVDTTSDHIDSHQVVHQRPTVDHDERIPPGDHHSPSQYEHESITHHHPQETDPSIGYGGTPTLPIYETELHHETLDWQTENPPEETSYEASDETDEQNQQVTEINHLISNMIAKLSTFPKKETLSPALIQQYGSPDSVPNTRHSQQHGQPLVIGSSISNQDPSLSSVSAWQQTDDRNKVHPVNPTESNPVRKGLVLAFFRRSPSFQQMLRDEHINNTSSETPERPSKQVSSLNNMPPLAEHHMNYVNGHNPDLVSIHHKVESIKTEPGGIKDPYWINRRPLHHLQSEEGYGHTQKHENTAVFSQSQRPVSVRVHPPHHKPQIHVLHQNNQMPSSNLGQHFFHYHHHHAGHVPQEPSSSTQSPLQLGMNEETLDEITSAERSHQSLHRPHFEAHGSLETNSLDQKNQHASFNTESPLNSAENFSGEAEDDDDDDSNESKEAEAEKEPQSFSGSSGEKWKECPLKFLCVPEEYCNIVGVIVKAPVFSTKLWQHFRVPLTPCLYETEKAGYCCRDPFYLGPWSGVANKLRT